MTADLTNFSYMNDVADDIIDHLREAGFTGDLSAQQVIALAEEVGEFVGTARRYLGMARRNGSFDDMSSELADVVITSFVTARILGVDLSAAIRNKIDVIFSRPWRERDA